MAKITGDFDPETIKKFRGVLDYYYWRGLLVVRSWPRKPVLPRSPAVQQTASDFADTARQLSQLPLIFRDTTTEIVRDTAWTWRDAWTSALYGHNIEFGLDAGPLPPEDVMPYLVCRLMTNTAGGDSTINVNSTSYVKPVVQLETTIDWAKFAPTHFRIYVAGLSSEAGQTITVQLALASSLSTPLSAAGNDLVIPNTPALNDSGWIAFAAAQSGAPIMALALKGSNTTVDLHQSYIEIQYWSPDT